MEEQMRAAAEIDLAAIENNAKIIKGMLGDARLMAVVKADGYGHGAAESARAAIRGGAGFLGVASVEEGVELRREGVDAPILVMGGAFGRGINDALEHGLRLAVFDGEIAREISRAAVRRGVKAIIHIKLDTGMSRLGLWAEGGVERAVAEALAIARLPGLEVEGLCSHLAASDSDPAFTQGQLAAFLEAEVALRRVGLAIPLRHIANSGGILNYPEAGLDMARAGIILYGMPPESDEAGERRLRALGLRPALTLKSRVISVKDIPAGATVGYSRAYRAERPISCAAVAIGYADGYSRLLSNRADLLINGRRAPIIGNICMDQLMADVTGIPAARGDEAVLIGSQGAEHITAAELARMQGTINYEIVTAIGKRVPKIYF